MTAELLQNDYVFDENVPGAVLLKKTGAEIKVLKHDFGYKAISSRTLERAAREPGEATIRITAGKNSLLVSKSWTRLIEGQPPQNRRVSVLWSTDPDDPKPFSISFMILNEFGDVGKEHILEFDKEGSPLLTDDYSKYLSIKLSEFVETHYEAPEEETAPGYFEKILELMIVRPVEPFFFPPR